MSVKIKVFLNFSSFECRKHSYRTETKKLQQLDPQSALSVPPCVIFIFFDEKQVKYKTSLIAPFKGKKIENVIFLYREKKKCRYISSFKSEKNEFF